MIGWTHVTDQPLATGERTSETSEKVGSGYRPAPRKLTCARLFGDNGLKISARQLPKVPMDFYLSFAIV